MIQHGGLFSAQRNNISCDHGSVESSLELLLHPGGHGTFKSVFIMHQRYYGLDTGSPRLLTSVQKTHRHWLTVVMRSEGKSPRQSLQETSGATLGPQLDWYQVDIPTEPWRKIKKNERGREIEPFKPAALNTIYRLYIITHNEEMPRVMTDVRIMFLIKVWSTLQTQ